MKYDRTVIAYHGCDAAVADRVLSGDPFRPSENDYDWLGSGIYFWEFGFDRALRFAAWQNKRGKTKRVAVVGAVLQLGKCFDLMDTRFTDELPIAFEMLTTAHEQTGQPLPRNEGMTPDKRLRHLDCAVLNLATRATCRSPFETRLASSACFAHDDEVSVRKSKKKLRLDPKAPGLDDETRRRRRVLAEMQRMSPEELFQLAVRAGIYTKKGKLTKNYRDDASPSACRPTD